MCQMIATGSFPFIRPALDASCGRVFGRARGLVQPTAHECRIERREQPRRLRATWLTEERLVDGAERVARRGAIPHALRGLVKLLLQRLRLAQLADEARDLFEEPLLVRGERHVGHRIANAELRVLRRPALEPDPREIDTRLQLVALRLRERLALALLGLAEGLDARDLQPIGDDREADTESGCGVILVHLR